MTYFFDVGGFEIPVAYSGTAPRGEFSITKEDYAVLEKRFGTIINLGFVLTERNSAIHWPERCRATGVSSLAYSSTVEIYFEPCNGWRDIPSPRGDNSAWMIGSDRRIMSGDEVMTDLNAIVADLIQQDQDRCTDAASRFLFELPRSAHLILDHVPAFSGNVSGKPTVRDRITTQYENMQITTNLCGHDAYLTAFSITGQKFVSRMPGVILP